MNVAHKHRINYYLYSCILLLWVIISVLTANITVGQDRNDYIHLADSKLSSAKYKGEIDTALINSQTKEAYNTARKNPVYSISLAHGALSASKHSKYQKGFADANLSLGAAYMAMYNPGDSATFYYLKALDSYSAINDFNGQARACYGLSFLYNFKSKPEKAKEYGELSVKFFGQAKNANEIIAALGTVIYLAKQAGNFEQALELSKKAIKTAISINDTTQWASSLNNQGNIFKDMYLFNQAIDSYFEAYRLWEEKNDSAGLAIAYGSIGNAYFFQEDYSKSLEFNFKKLHIIRNTGNLWENSKALDNIGLAYSILNKHDSAVYYMRQSLQLTKTLNYPIGVANSCDKMASAFIRMGEPDSAYFYSSKAVATAEKNNNKALAGYLVNMAKALEKLEKHQDALSVVQRAYKLAKNEHNAHTQRSSSYLLSEIYYSLNRLDLAYLFLTKYLKLDDSITNKEYMRKVTRLDIQHEYDKKQKAAKFEIKKHKQQIEILNKTNQLKTERLQRSWIIFIAFILLSLTGTVINFLVIKNKNHRIEKMSLEIRNYLLELKTLNKKEKGKQSIVNSLIENYELTPREAKIMELIATGISNDEIADNLFVSKNTIKFHIKNIFIKLDVSNRVQALVKTAL